MNRIERRTTGTRPGASVCNPGKPTRNTGMLGGSYLYQRRPNQISRQVSRNTTQINGIKILQNQGDRLKRVENKLEQIERQQAIGSSNIDLINDKTKTTIDLMNGSYKKQMQTMRDYIKELEFKIKALESNKPITVKAVKKNSDQANVTLEISEKN